jgi:hypothetical protein
MAYRHKISDDVLNARAKRGRHLKPKIDKCGGCVHWQPPEDDEWGWCPRQGITTTAKGCCALHEAK